MDAFLLPLWIVVGLAVASLFAGIGRRRTVAPREPARFATIDGLRGYLALAVVAHHFIIWSNIVTTGGSWVAPRESWANQLGAGAVALFFMTTGFLFYPDIERGWVRGRWTRFYVKRVFRIVPMTACSVALVALVVGIESRALPNAETWADAGKWISGWSQARLLGVYGVGRINAFVLWSLWYEWVFYVMLVPLLAILADMLGAQRRALPLLALATVLLARASQSTPVTLVYLPLFACGMIARFVADIPALRPILASRAAGAVALLALGWAMYGFHAPYGAALPLFTVFFIVVAGGNTLFGLLVRKGAIALGDLSFGVYLLHGLVLYLWFTRGFGGWSGATSPMVLPLLFCLVVTIARLGFIWVERPGISLGAALLDWRRRPSDSRAAVA